MDELIDAFIGLLTAGGIHAVGAMPGELAPHLTGSAVAVEVRRMDASPKTYLGLRQGQELYGRHIQGEVNLCVLSPASSGAGACRSAMDQVLALLADGIPGLSLLSLTAEAPVYRENNMEGNITLSFRCWLCETPAQGTDVPISQFILEGAFS